MKVLQKLKYRK